MKCVSVFQITFLLRRESLQSICLRNKKSIRRDLVLYANMDHFDCGNHSKFSAKWKTSFHLLDSRKFTLIERNYSVLFQTPVKLLDIRLIDINNKNSTARRDRLELKRIIIQGKWIVHVIFQTDFPTNDVIYNPKCGMSFFKYNPTVS